MQNDTLAVSDHDLTIAEMSHLYGISLRTLRFYEQVGLLRPRRVGLQRFYTLKDSVRVRLILAGKKLGFSLREIQELIRSHRSEEIGEATDRLVETLDLATIEQKLTALERQRADLDAAIAELQAIAQEPKRV